MTEHILEILEKAGNAISLFAAAIIIVGFVIAAGRWFQRMRLEGPRSALERYRLRLGRSVLIGLEILVAATIIKTITVEPTMEGLGLLAGMVIIRAMLGWTTALEISGRWPWQGR